MSRDLVEIKTFVTRYEAEIAQSLLEAYGVGAMVAADDCGGVDPSLLPGVGGARLLVPAERAEQARQLLEGERTV